MRDLILLFVHVVTLGKRRISDGIPLPIWKGKQLPDIDILMGEPGLSQLVVCEVKWQLSGSSTREVINRDEYLKKGLRQLEAIREFLTVHPWFLRSRALLDRSTQPSDFDLRRIERLSQHIPRPKGREICRPLDLIGLGQNGAAKHPRLTAH
jgi:hypothetical protein